MSFDNIIPDSEKKIIELFKPLVVKNGCRQISEKKYLRKIAKCSKTKLSKIWIFLDRPILKTIKKKLHLLIIFLTNIEKQTVEFFSNHTNT